MEHRIAFPAPLRQPGGLLRRLRLMLALHASRRPLGRLDPHLLKDIGLDAGEAGAELARPAWDVPKSWLR